MLESDSPILSVQVPEMLKLPFILKCMPLIIQLMTTALTHCLNGTSGVIISSNPNHATSDCYVQACRILAGGCSGISTVSRVRVMVMVMVRDQYVKGLIWYHGM